jgi:branched-chain amino acid transport system substrate-binding protein
MHAITVSLMAVAFAVPGFAVAQDTRNLVVAAPFADYPLTSAQMLAGAKAALANGWQIKPVEAGCDDNAGISALAAIEAARPTVIIGLPCIASLATVLQKFGPKGVPIITINSRAVGVAVDANKQGWPLLRIGPREHGDVEAAIGLIASDRAKAKIAVLDDGSTYGRDYADRLRTGLTEKSLSPVYVADFSAEQSSITAVINRLRSSATTHVLIIAEIFTAATLANAIRSELPNVTIAGPDTLLERDAELALPIGTKVIARAFDVPDTVVTKINASFADPFNAPIETAFDAFVAVEIASQMIANPTNRSFTTSLGELTGASDGFFDPAPYGWLTFDGANFVPVTQ